MMEAAAEAMPDNLGPTADQHAPTPDISLPAAARTATQTETGTQKNKRTQTEDECDRRAEVRRPFAREDE